MRSVAVSLVSNVQYLCQCELDHSVTFIVAVQKSYLTCLDNMYSVGIQVVEG